VEGLGVLQRRDVSEEVRGLDQDSRAALRRLGVRFGAYHVFMPMLLKPAPAGLITLLWALKNEGKERAGYGDVVNVLAAGRTSVVVDPAFDQQFYRLAGYRVLGRRAVRIDILERLADLIRPALAWRPGAGTRAEGAFDGGRFIVTPAMMSILGATAEDMEEILKSLGYRQEAMDAAAVTAKLAELDAFAAAAATAAQAEVVEEETVFKAAVPASAPASEAKPAVPAAEPVPAPVKAVAQAKAASEAVEAPAEEPKPILLWRQGRFEGRNRNHDQNQNRQRNHRPQQGDARKSDAGSEGGDAQGARDNRGGAKRFDKNRRNDGEGQDRGQNKREGFKGKPRDGNRDHRQSKRDNVNPQANKRVEQERPVRIDPDSPFAKLLALKEQMKK